MIDYKRTLFKIMTEQNRNTQENSLERNRDILQRWEYKFLKRVRGLKAIGMLGIDAYAYPEEWKPENSNFMSQVEKLGEEGWELIAIVPRSSYGGKMGAGFTGEETWAFKRPKI
jgi:hypothetical protein